MTQARGYLGRFVLPVGLFLAACASWIVAGQLDSNEPSPPDSYLPGAVSEPDVDERLPEFSEQDARPAG